MRLLAIVVSAIVLYLVAGILLSMISTNSDEVSCAEKDEIYISSNGVHLDFVIPRSYLNEDRLRELHIPEDAEYVSFGWGDKGFYLQTPNWSDLKFSVAFKALFLKSESAMHVDYHYGRSESWTSLALCRDQFMVIEEFIFAHFEKTEGGHFQKIDFEGYNSTDSFYEAEKSYNLILTCNEWVNLALKKAGVKTSIWSPFEFGVIHQISTD